MAKKHNVLTNNDLHNPKGILVESTASMLVMSQSINTVTGSFHFIPDATDTYTLGNAARAWKELYVSTSSINFVDPAGNTVHSIKATADGITFVSSSGVVADVSGSVISGSKLHIVGDTFIGGDLTLGDADTDSINIGADLTSNLIPNADATYDLGSTTKGWNDLHLGSGGVINFDGGDVTATHSANLVSIAGGNTRVIRLEIDSANDYLDVDTDLKIIAAADIILDPGGNNVLPGSDDTDDLGASGTQWKDLYIDGVAYIDTLNADALGANLDHGNYNSTNVDIDSGAIDGVTIGGASAGAITGTTIDATTDFTIGGTVITDGQIAEDGNFTMDIAGDLLLDVDGGDVTITDNGADLLTINATKVSGSATSSGSFAHIAVNSVSASRIEVDSIQGNWTNAGNTIADLGTVTTANIDGGTVDGTTIGASSHTTIKGTTIDATTDFTIGGTVITDNTITDDGTLVIASTTATSFSEGNITNVGSIGLDSIAADDGSSFTISNNWTNAGNTIADLGSVTTVDINGGTINGITDLAVADGGTGASTFTDGGVLLGSGTSAVTAMAVLADGEFIVGDGTTDPVAESGDTARTSLGVGTGDSPTFSGATAGNVQVGVTGDNELDTSSGNLTIDSAGGTITLDDHVIVSGDFTVSGTRTIVNSTTVDIADNIIELNAGTSDGGLYVKETSGGAATGSMLWDVSSNRWFAGTAGSETNVVLVDTTDTLTNKTLTSPDINGGTWNGTVDGNSTAAGITWADLGSVTTIDINGGTINGITDLAVADGGTGASTLTQNGVLIGNGTSAVSAVDLSTDGVIVIGDGSGNPTTLDVGGSGGITILGTIATGVWNGTAIDTAYIDTTLTSQTSMYNTSLKVGRDSGGDWIDFGTDDNIKVYLSNVEEFRFASGGTFHADADVVAYSSTVASDMSLKENITDTKYGLDDIMKLRGVDFDWKREDMGHDVGVLAQEVEAVIPELVKEHEGLNGREKFKAVDYNKLVPVLIESIKELKKEIDDLKSN